METATQRIFIGFIFPPENVAELMNLLEPLKTSLPKSTHWTHPSDLHLTICFLGATPEVLIPQLKDYIDALNFQDPIVLRLDRFGFFPSHDKPRVFWIGPTHSPTPLFEISQSLISSSKSLGLKPDEKNLIPHISLCRFRQPSKTFDLHRLSRPSIALEITEIGIYESLRTPLSDAPRYKIIHRRVAQNLCRARPDLKK